MAAIDVGSNGIRLVIADVSKKFKANLDSHISEFPFTIVHAQRAAVRLGADAFHLGYLTDATVDMVTEVLQSFRDKMDGLKVSHYRAVATSAVRESSNGQAFAKTIRKRTGINLEIIGGLEEAQLMFHAISVSYPLHDESVILIDMGGGSVELTVAHEGRALGAETLPLGPVRLLAQLDSQGIPEKQIASLVTSHAHGVRTFVNTELTHRENSLVSYAAGGNIEAIGKLRIPILGKTKSYKIKLNDLQTITPVLLGMSVEERISEFNLRPDRADVIAVAAVVLQMIMHEAGLKRILIPGLGIKDGILLQLKINSFS